VLQDLSSLARSEMRFVPPSSLPPPPPTRREGGRAGGQGFEVEVWELANEVGGTWLYSELVAECRGNIYRSLVTNLPKEIMQ